ncbi:MAG: FKBP-type peptidyl-prolyl cis-trans isomerase [Pseudomonadota bacterium]|nr:FKBP-type peptidyl-prolyl cis-trans isomerase [Pseudomonadota bacterium]
MTAAVLLAACGGGGKPPTAPADTASPASQPVPQTAALEIRELKPGTGAAIAAGQKAAVQYTGWLYETSAPDGKGKEFDSSRNSGQAFNFVVGAGQVIKGWDQGVLGMKVGERRRLTIPADLAYGDAGAGGIIPPGATLVFDVDLLAIE